MRHTRSPSAWVPALLLACMLAAAPSALAEVSWSEVSAPSPGTVGPFANELHAVDGVAADDVWAVGAIDPGPNYNSRATLALHFDGSSWRVVPTPNPDGAGTGVDVDRAMLHDVEAISANDAWAVGVADSIDWLGGLAVVLRWNGSSWTTVAVPRLGDEIALNRLNAVSAVSASDVWAVGSYNLYEGYGSQYGTLIYHWDGSTWSMVPNSCNATEDVVAISMNDVWAVGVDTCHWDGSTWSPIPNAAPPYNGFTTLRSVAASPSGDVWAVGFNAISYFEGYLYSGRIERWSGSEWMATSAYAQGDHLDGVLALAGDDAWAVGSDFGNPLVLHWDGSSWTAIEGLPSPGISASLNGVAVAGSDLWTAGIVFNDDAPGRNLILRGTGSNAPPPGGEASVTGTVVGRRRAPISGATVAWSGPSSGSTTTAADGRYVMTSTQGGTYSVTASVPGCRSATSSVALSPGEAVVLNFRLRC